MRSFILRVFRFDASRDYEFYYKPYEINLKDINDSSTLYDVLGLVKQQDRYFNMPDCDEFVRIENKVLSLNTNINELIKKFGNDFCVSAIDLKRAKLDLMCDDSDFIKVFDYFKNICNADDYKDYLTYKFLYYASDIREYNDEFLGDSAFVFANKLLEKYPNKRKDILDIVFDKEKGIEYSVSLKPFLYSDYEKYEEIKNSLKHQKEIR